MNLPNKITLSRIALTFVFMIFLFSDALAGKIAALVIFLVASATDFLDGFLAKKYKITSDFGKIMDPVADKLLTIAAFMAFVEMKLVPAWIVVVIIARELLITSIRLKALMNGDVLAAGAGGKRKTFSQILTIVLILIFIIVKEAGITVFGFWGPDMELWYSRIIYAMMLITAALTLLSGVSYIAGNKRYFLSGGEHGQK